MSEAQPQRGAEWHLLFGLLALQNGLISQKQLVVAFGKWTSNKSVPLNEILLDIGALDEQVFQVLQQLVELHVKRHDCDPEKSLMSLSGSELPDVADDLKAMGDAELNKSIATIVRDDSSLPSAPQTVGGATSNSGRFRILRRLPGARGGMGEISVALDDELGRQVALKQILSDKADHQSYRQKFQVEAEITGNLEHPGIVPVYGLGTSPDGRPYYAMRLVHGDNLSAKIKEFHQGSTSLAGKRRQVDYNSVEFHGLIDRLIDVAQAVRYAHSRGVLHRDLKPGNILVGEYGETLVIDWGLARLPQTMERATDSLAVDSAFEVKDVLNIRSGTQVDATVQGQVLGTVGYAPPEQLNGRVDLIGPRSDVYALGAMLYQVLVCQTPIERSGDRRLREQIKDTIDGNITSPRQLNRAVPKSLSAICMRALQREPADRYRSVEAFIDELESWKADQPIAAAPDSLADRALRLARRYRSATLATAAALLFVSIVTSAAVVSIQAARRRADDAKRFAVTLQGFALDDMVTAFQKGKASEDLSMGAALWEASVKFAEAVPNDAKSLINLHVGFGDKLLANGELDAAGRHFERARILLANPHVSQELSWQVRNGAAVVRWRKGDPEALGLLNAIRAEIKRETKETPRWFDLSFASALKNTLGSLDLAARLEAIDEASALYARHCPREHEPPDSVSHNFVQMMVHRGLTWQRVYRILDLPEMRWRCWPLSVVSAHRSISSMREARDALRQLIDRSQAAEIPDDLLYGEMWSEYAKVMHRLGIFEPDSQAKLGNLVDADDAYTTACRLLIDELGTQHWRTVETSYSWMVLLNQHLRDAGPPDLSDRIRRGTKYYVASFLRDNSNPLTKLEQNGVGALSQLSLATVEEIDSVQLQEWLQLDRALRAALAKQ